MSSKEDQKDSTPVQKTDADSETKKPSRQELRAQIKAKIERSQEIKARKQAKVPNVKAKDAMTAEEKQKLNDMLGDLKNKAAIQVIGETDMKREFSVPQKLKDLKEVPTIFFKNCTGGNYLITRRVTKIMIENCSNCSFSVQGGVLTRTAEAWHVKDVTLDVGCELKTLQLDMATNVDVTFSQWRHFFSVVWNQLENCNFTFLDSPEHNLHTGFTEMLHKYPDSSLKTDQFIVRFIGDKLTSERCLRLKNGHLSTEREAVDWERRNQLFKDRYLAKTLKEAKIHLKEDKSKVDTKVKPNDKCPCGSGKKYKKCCFGKKAVSGLATSERKITYK
jgi:hypothetical protein